MAIDPESHAAPACYRQTPAYLDDQMLRIHSCLVYHEMYGSNVSFSSAFMYNLAIFHNVVYFWRAGAKNG